MDWKIFLEEDEIEKCRIFAENSAKTQRPYRSGGSQIRDLGLMIADTLRGKLGEVVCKKFLEQKPLHVKGIKLDFGIYPRGKWDEADVVLGDKSISIKSVKHFSSWMLIESKDILRGDIYDYYILILVNKEMNGGSVAGYATMEEIVDGDQHTLQLKKGEPIPGTGTELDADNYARHRKHLHNSLADWVSLSKELRHQ